ncbi:MAG: CBU_0592 family membrane protein [Streptomycetales bacterium]
MDQIVQVAGALLVLAGFVLAQLRVLDPASYPYLWLNFAGAGVLSVVALVDDDWGFLLLEGVWTLVSLGGLIARGSSRWRGSRRGAEATLR